MGADLGGGGEGGAGEGGGKEAVQGPPAQLAASQYDASVPQRPCRQAVHEFRCSRVNDTVLCVPPMWPWQPG